MRLSLLTALRCASVLLLALALTLPPAQAQSRDVAQALQAFDTDLDRRSIDLNELIAGGPPKDGIPALDDPAFIAPTEAAAWLADDEPVVLLTVGDAARAYPLQILIWHEIVNDVVGGMPVAVTFCPLCYSAVAFDRRLDGRTLAFGVSGLLRHSDMVMFDRQTETLWQQLSGEAIVGDLVGHTLTQLPAQIISFAQFREAYPDGDVLARPAGHRRPYGENPYVGYDDVSQRPFLFRGDPDGRLKPMEKVVAVPLADAPRAYPHRLTRDERVIHDTAGGQPLVVFHAPGAVSALDAGTIAESREIGSTGVFDPRLDGRRLTFRYADGRFTDEQTGSTWTVTGRATDGPLAGQQLTRLPHGDYFAFAWLVFRPETTIYQSPVEP